MGQEHIGQLVEVCLHDDSDCSIFGVTLRGKLTAVSPTQQLARITFHGGASIAVPLATVSPAWAGDVR